MKKGSPANVAVPQTPEWVADVDNLTKTINGTEGSKTVMNYGDMEPSTLQWSDKKSEPQSKGKDGETTSVRSDCVSLRGGVSRTESEREEFGMGEKQKLCEGWMETDEKRASNMEVRYGVKSIPYSEIQVEEENVMPEKAAGVFNTSVTVLRSTSHPEYPQDRVDDWRNVEEEKSHFLGTHSSHGTHPEEHYRDWPIESKPYCCIYDESCRQALKLSASMLTSALIFPLLVWGGYIFLPFDAPQLDSAPLRLVYTLRCSVFAVIPIVLGVSRLWYRSLKPRFEGESEVKQVAVHQRYVEDSISLFLLYFLQLTVMAAYLNQDLLKLVPLLTIVFAFGRLVYWIAAVCDSCIRGVGFGFSFLPMLVMLVANLYFIFLSDSADSMNSVVLAGGQWGTTPTTAGTSVSNGVINAAVSVETFPRPSNMQSASHPQEELSAMDTDTGPSTSAGRPNYIVSGTAGRPNFSLINQQQHNSDTIMDLEGGVDPETGERAQG
ncbi:Transmembrane protein 79 [Triplophysa tibetana]|uniref:Transmembrane protein 79 n=1 Tax=Triplophysa tibetana TaxID=1572043 RepID=A0A5A9N049_9TELE|nr:Transmembrane protein 79 [Triplophysa tibetana]